MIELGSRAFFVRLGVPPKGLIGAGYALSEPWEDIHWLADKAAAGATTHYLKLRLEFLRDTPIIALDELARPPFRRFRWAVRQSGRDAVVDRRRARAVVGGARCREAASKPK